MIWQLMKTFVKEGGLYLAFVIMGCLLLLSFWVSNNVRDGLMKEFRHQSMTLVFSSEPSNEMRDLLNKSSAVVRYEIRSAFENKVKIQKEYPELASTLADLDDEFFPSSALITLRDLPGFERELKRVPDVIEKSIVHSPPQKIATFFNGLLGLFGFLWFLLLALLIHFKLERLAVRESARWSLMKMLGAKPSQIFLPACWIQMGQIAVGSLCVLLLTGLSMSYLRRLFDWEWAGLSMGAQLGFFVGSVVIGVFMFFLIFAGRFRRTALG